MTAFNKAKVSGAFAAAFDPFGDAGAAKAGPDLARSPNAVRRERYGPGPQLDVRTVDLVGGMGLALFDRATGQVLPGQQGGTMDYSVNDVPTLTVRFRVTGDDVKMGNNTQQAAQAADKAMEEADAANDLQAAFRAYGALTEANQARFQQAVGVAGDAVTIRRLSDVANRQDEELCALRNLAIDLNHAAFKGAREDSLRRLAKAFQMTATALRNRWCF